VRGYASVTSPTADHGAGGPNSSCDQTRNDCTYIKVGGKGLITGSVEVVRELPKRLGVAALVADCTSFDQFPTKLAYWVSIGLRVRVSVRTLCIDIAQPLYEPCQAPFIGSNCAPSSPRFHINFSPKL
jgi:hypothetical protein